MRTVKPKLLFLILAIYIASNSFSELFSATLELLPVDDGSYSYHDGYVKISGTWTYFTNTSITRGQIKVYLLDTWEFWGPGSPVPPQTDYNSGLIEFNLSSAAGLFTSGNFQAFLVLKVKTVRRAYATTFLVYDMNDANEDGIIGETDVKNRLSITSQDISSVQPEDVISINVTSTIEHDLFASEQTAFSGFILSASSDAFACCPIYDIDFYSSYDGENNAPRLSIASGEFTTTTTTQPTTTTTVQQTTTTTTAPATLINLSSFTATPKFSKVTIQWSTESETDNSGFNLYRSESENGEYIKINDSLIPAQGSQLTVHHMSLLIPM